MFVKPSVCLGVGINYRNVIANDIVKNLHHIDCLEINTERLFIERDNVLMNKIIYTIPIVLHGLTLSIGSDQSIKKNYLDTLSHTLHRSNCHWFSEHLAITGIHDFSARTLMSIAFTETTIERIVNKVNTIQQYTHKPFLLENIAYYYVMPDSHLTEIAFVKAILEKTQCGLLLDLNNLYVNAINHHYDPYLFIDQLPSDRIVELHLAGCDYVGELLVDTHASPSREEVLDLLLYVVKKIPINGVIIERDAKLTYFSELIDEIYLVKDLLKQAISK